MKDPRYQHQSFLVKCYRWWRYKAPSKVVGVFHLLRWVVQGAHPITFGEETVSYKETAIVIWRLATSTGNIKAQHHFTLDEVFDRL